MFFKIDIFNPLAAFFVQIAASGGRFCLQPRVKQMFSSYKNHRSLTL